MVAEAEVCGEISCFDRHKETDRSVPASLVLRGMYYFGRNDRNDGIKDAFYI